MVTPIISNIEMRMAERLLQDRTASEFESADLIQMNQSNQLVCTCPCNGECLDGICACKCPECRASRAATRQLLLPAILEKMGVIDVTA